MTVRGIPEGYVREGEKLLLTLEQVVDPRHTVLLVVDVQNDFVYGKGNLETPAGRRNPCEEIIPRLNHFIEECRNFRVPVIYIVTVHGRDLDLPPYKARVVRRKQGLACMLGSKGSEFPEKLNRPVPGEPVVTKHGYDAMADHNLHTILQNRGAKSLIMSGIDTGVCVDTTLRHAFHLGYYIVVARDICASEEAERHDYALKLTENYFGLVSTTEEIVRIWEDYRRAA